MGAMGSTENDNETKHAPMKKNDENQTQQAVVMDAGRPAKRLRGGDDQQSETPPALFGSEHPTLEECLFSSAYLEPVDLIRLLHVCKAARRATVPKLKKLEESTKEHTKMFRGWLCCPRITQGNAVFEEMAPEAVTDDLAGPLRLDVIAEMWTDIAQRFVILDYNKCYDRERSTVALFDKKGAFVALYMFQSVQFYEDYVTKDQMTVFNAGGGFDCSMPHFRLSTSGWFTAEMHDDSDDDDDSFFHCEDATFNKWRKPRQAQTDYEWQEGWMGDVAAPHYSLIESFAGCLSPTEALFVLMHALSSDTRGIFVCTVALFDHLAVDVSHVYGVESGRYIRRLHEWRDNLQARHYN
jgi:hypothetical protein